MENGATSGNKIKRFFLLERDGSVQGVTLGGATVLLLCCLVLCYIFFKPKKDIRKAVPKQSFAEKFVCGRDTIRYVTSQQDLVFFGKVTSNENNVIPVYSLVSGHVEDIKVSIGDYIHKGQILARIKSGDVSEIISDYRSSESNLHVAEKNLAVADTLFKAKFSSQLDLLNARRDYKVAVNEHKKSLEKLKIYHISPSDENSYFNIVSPIDGYVIEKNINNNVEVRADNSSNLFTISDLKTVWVYANIFEEDAPRVHQGQKVVISTQSYPGKTFKGIIDNVNSVLDPSSRTVRIRIVINNEEGLLKPEMTALVTVEIPGSEKILAVEPKGVVFDKDKYYVVKIIDTNFKVAQVEVIKKTSMYTYLGKGATAGEVIVGEGSLILYNELTNKP